MSGSQVSSFEDKMRMKSHVDTLEKVAGQKQKAACKGRVWASKERRETEKYRAGELLTAGVCCRLKSRGL